MNGIILYFLFVQDIIDLCEKIFIEINAVSSFIVGIFWLCIYRPVFLEIDLIDLDKKTRKQSAFIDKMSCVLRHT